MLLDYLKTITSPMDLSTIKLKMDRCEYQIMAEFNTDVTLMLHNCLHYNEEGSEMSVVRVLSNARQEAFSFQIVTGFFSICAWFQWAEYLLFAWHLCKQNIESVLRGDASLAVELLPPHTFGSNDLDSDEDITLINTVLVGENALLEDPEVHCQDQPSNLLGKRKAADDAFDGDINLLPAEAASKMN